MQFNDETHSIFFFVQFSCTFSHSYWTHWPAKSDEGMMHPTVWRECIVVADPERWPLDQIPCTCLGSSEYLRVIVNRKWRQSWRLAGCYFILMYQEAHFLLDAQQVSRLQKMTTNLTPMEVSIIDENSNYWRCSLRFKFLRTLNAAKTCMCHSTKMYDDITKQEMRTLSEQGHICHTWIMHGNVIQKTNAMSQSHMLDPTPLLAATCIFLYFYL